MKRFALSILFSSMISLPVWAQEGPKTVDFGPLETLVIEGANGSNSFNVEIADTDEEQAHGLMYRENLPADQGMLFEFEEPKIATIWMKNTPISLDILFVRSNGKILKIEHFAKPYSLRSASSEGVVAAVVELNGGRARDLGIMPGDVVKHPFFGNADN